MALGSPPINFWTPTADELPDYEDLVPPPQPPIQLVDPIDHLNLQLDMVWSTPNPRILFLYLTQHAHVDITGYLRIQEPWHVLPEDWQFWRDLIHDLSELVNGPKRNNPPED